ncbi:hypothetical protein LINPERHAP1_LOCUS15163 [Linum perenne]
MAFSDESEGEEDDDDPRCATIRILVEEKRRVRRKFDNAIIVSTLGKSFPFPFMSRKLPQIWAKKGRLQISNAGWGYYVVKFETVSDYERAMFGGPLDGGGSLCGYPRMAIVFPTGGLTDHNFESLG